MLINANINARCSGRPNAPLSPVACQLRFREIVQATSKMELWYAWRQASLILYGVSHALTILMAMLYAMDLKNFNSAAPARAMAVCVVIFAAFELNMRYVALKNEIV